MKIIASITALFLIALPVFARQHAFVKIPVTCIRTQPRHSAEQSSQAILGTPLTILSQSNGWSKVSTPDGYTGYIKSNTIEPVSDAAYANWQNAERVICKVWLTSLENSDGTVAGYVTYGSILNRNGNDTSSMFGVTLPDGNPAWIKQTDVWPDTSLWTASFCAANQAETVITHAYTMLGAPYLWGGTSSLAPDCSGFTQIAYSSVGLLLPRDTSMQIKCGIPVASLNEALPGDLIFYGHEGKVDHVAIYLGNRKIIHSSGCVRVCRMNNNAPGTEALYSDKPMCIRRILGEDNGSKTGIVEIATSEIFFGQHTTQTK